MNSPYVTDFSKFFAPFIQMRRASPTDNVHHLAQGVYVFQIIGTSMVRKYKALYPNLEMGAVNNYQLQMGSFLPRFIEALVQEAAIWDESHPEATPEDQATFAAQQAKDLSDFMQQLATWHDEFMAALVTKP